MAELNASRFNGDYNATDGSFAQSNDTITIFRLYIIILYVVLALGVPGNALSAIVWLRRGVAGNNSSAVYLASLAIVDLVYLLFSAVYIFFRRDNWLYVCCMYLLTSASDLEPLLVLGFSVERFIAILRPLRVRSVLLAGNGSRNGYEPTNLALAVDLVTWLLLSDFQISKTFPLLNRS